MSLEEKNLPKDEEDIAIDPQELIAQNLRASHTIISAIERSKSIIEDMLDFVPDLFIIATEEGRILKGNYTAEDMFQVEPEGCFGLNIYDLFSAETQKIFKTKISQASEIKGMNRGIQFELPVDIDSDNVIDLHWNIRPLNEFNDRRGKLFSIMGRNITDLKMLEKKLTEIFAAVPLGIFILDKNGKIDGPHSAFSEYIFNTSKLEDKNVLNELFERNKNNLTRLNYSGYIEFKNVLGSEDTWFEMSKDRFPKDIKYVTDNGEEKYLCLTYSPITVNEIVEKVLVVVRDNTELVKSQRELALRKEHEDRCVSRYLDIERNDIETLRTIEKEIPLYISRLEKEINSSSLDKILFELHGIKSTARASMLGDLTKMCHDIEDELMTWSQIEDKDILNKYFKDIQKEWFDTHKLIKAFCKADAEDNKIEEHQDIIKFKELEKEKSELINHIATAMKQANAELSPELTNELRYLGFERLDSFESTLSKLTSETAINVRKKVNIKYNWNNSRLPPIYLL